MDEVIPWKEWVRIILPFYYKKQRDRPPENVEVMLRMYLLQIWFHLSDAGVEDAIARMDGIRCGMKPTSCPDRLAQALKTAR